MRSYASREEYDAFICEAKRKYPPVDSAYVPSGRCPLPNFVLLPIGGGIGAIVGALAGALTITLVGGFVWCALKLGEMLARFLSVIAYGPILLAVLVGLAGCAAAYAITGAATGWTVAKAGKFGKNRSMLAATVGSVAAGIAACYLAYASTTWCQENIRFFGEIAEGAKILYVGSTGWWCLAYVLIVGASVAVTIGTQASWPFCENCDEYMLQNELVGFSASKLQAGLASLEADKVGEFRQLTSASASEDCKPHLHVCQQCSEGLLEIQLTLQGQCPDKQDPSEVEEFSSTWTVLSKLLPSKAVQTLTT